MLRGQEQDLLTGLVSGWLSARVCIECIFFQVAGSFVDCSEVLQVLSCAEDSRSLGWVESWIGDVWWCIADRQFDISLCR